MASFVSAPPTKTAKLKFERPMNYEKEYYEYEGFWNNYDSLYRNNIDKINITFNFLRPDVKSVLDAACGNGIFTNMLIEKFPKLKVTAFDRSEAALKHVKAEKYLAEIDNIPFADSSFDCVVAHDVIEHLPVGIYEKALSEIARVAKKYIIIGVPNNEDVMQRSTQCPSCKAIFNYDLHMRSFSKEKMKELFKEFSFHNVSIETCDKNVKYYGQDMYSRIFYAEISKRFKSPICPICGFKNKQDQNEPSLVARPKSRSIGSLIKAIPKLVWPTQTFDYEMVALFEKKD